MLPLKVVYDTIMRKLLLFIGVVAIAGLFFIRLQKPLFIAHRPSGSIPTYQAAADTDASVSLFDENIEQITQIDITPDGQFMLVGTLTGTVWIYHRVEGVFVRQSDPFFVLKTSQPGFPPEEAGLTGVAFGADFDKSGDVFLLHSFAFEKKSFRNRVTRVTFTRRGNKVIGANPEQIFEANTPGTGSHQIQDGIGIRIENKPHLLFTIGEGFDGKQALDPKKEAGKVMIIGRDGSTPVGARPFPESPKVQALGIRNAPAIAINPKNGKIAIGDTGPNNYDRFLYGKLYDPDGKNSHKLSFNWDGSEDSLKKGASDVYDKNKEMVLHRWAPTETAVNIVWLDAERILVALFGQTGSKNNTPGKKIMLGTLKEGARNTITLTPLIERTPAGEGQLGHPLGLALDPIAGDIYFGDIMEGRIYKISFEREVN